MTAKQIAVKRYVVMLSDDERERLDGLIHAGKYSARLLTKARILLKADASEAGEGWRDSQIAAALDTSIDTVARTRQQLVEEGLEAVLVRKHETVQNLGVVMPRSETDAEPIVLRRHDRNRSCR